MNCNINNNIMQFEKKKKESQQTSQDDKVINSVGIPKYNNLA